MEDTNQEVTVDAPVVEAVVEASIEVATEEAPKVRATEKVAEENSDIIENTSIQEAVVNNDDGQKVIAAPKKVKVPRKSNTAANKDGVIASKAADHALFGPSKTAAAKTKSNKNEVTVAVFSEKNVRWGGVGELSKGYNIVTEDAAAQWLTKNYVRKATPEEVATHYGK